MDIHPITTQSFALIDQEIGPHAWSEQEYAIIRRAIHTTADFELKDLFHFSPGAIQAGMTALRQNVPVIVDVQMVAVGIASTLAKAGKPKAYCALDYPGEGPTQTAGGMLNLSRTYPHGLFVIGNAPTALLALVEQIKSRNVRPALVIGVPVGFVAVEEAKQALAVLDIPQIQVRGRKGGSTIAAAIVNALLHLASVD
jgi:precorrin-8X/cobalt-precorrin-8 methylmutase